MSTGANIPGGAGFKSTEIVQSTIDFYVDDVNGNNSNNGTTPTTAFEDMTTARAAAALLTGLQTIYVFTGTYTNEGIILSSLGFTDAFTLDWYFETGVNFNTITSIITAPGAHFFDFPSLSIRGNGKLKYTGSASVIDTTDAFLTLLTIECFSFDVFPTAAAVKPILLNAQGDDTLDIALTTIGLDPGSVGYTSAVFTNGTEYFITSENTSATKTLDAISIKGGSFKCLDARCYFGHTAVPEVRLDFFTKGIQDSGNAEGIRVEGVKFVLRANALDAQLGPLNVRATGFGANEITITDHNDVLFPWNSEIEVHGGSTIIERCVWIDTVGRFIGVLTAGELIIKDSTFNGVVSQMISANAASNELDIYNSSIKTTTGDCILIATDDVMILNCFLASDDAGGFAISAAPAPGRSADMHNTVGNRALSNVTDTLGGYTQNAAFGNIK